MTTYYKDIRTHVEHTANCYVVRAEGENRIGEVRFQVRVVDKKRVEQHEQGPVEDCGCGKQTHSATSYGFHSGPESGFGSARSLQAKGTM